MIDQAQKSIEFTDKIVIFILLTRVALLFIRQVYIVHTRDSSGSNAIVTATGVRRITITISAVIYVLYSF